MSLARYCVVWGVQVRHKCVVRAVCGVCVLDCRVLCVVCARKDRRGHGHETRPWVLYPIAPVPPLPLSTLHICLCMSVYCSTCFVVLVPLLCFGKRFLSRDTAERVDFSCVRPFVEGPTSGHTPACCHLTPGSFRQLLMGFGFYIEPWMFKNTLFNVKIK